MGGRADELPPITLDHITGFAGDAAHVLAAHPSKPDLVYYAAGAVVVQQSLGNPRDQTLFHGHDEAVSALAVSPDGGFMASGERAAVHGTETGAAVIIWELATCRALFTMRGHTTEVLSMAFSPDERFLATLSEDKLFVFDLFNGEVVSSVPLDQPGRFLVWKDVESTTGKVKRYTLLTCSGTQIRSLFLEYDPKSMQYACTAEAFQLPNIGLVRLYTSACLHGTGELVAGTKSGDFVVFALKTKVFRYKAPVARNGILSVASVGDTLFVGTGDGMVKKVQGSDQIWDVLDEVQLEGAVTNVVPTATGTHLLVGTNASCVYRVAAGTLEASLLFRACDAPINGIAPLQGGRVVCAATDKDTVLWSTERMTGQERLMQAGTCCCTFKDTVVLGADNGSLYCFAADGSGLRWHLHQAHRTAISTVFVSALFIVTGAVDGTVRVWTPKTRELAAQYAMHKGRVTAVAPDLSAPHRILSAGEDGTIVTYDLERERKHSFHAVKGGHFVALVPTTDGFMTVGKFGTVQQWDRDSPDPVHTVRVPGALFSCAALSPDRATLALGEVDEQLVLLLDLKSELPVAAGSAHTGEIRQLCWAPSGRALFSGGADACLCVWDLSSE